MLLYTSGHVYAEEGLEPAISDYKERQKLFIMSWQRVLGHQRQQEMFANAVRRKRLGHAYLFAGPHGVGKKLFALELAQTLLCERSSSTQFEACGECSGCRQVLSNSHPDLMRVSLPEGKTELPIDLFIGSADKRGREGLCHELSLSPMHGGHRIAIIDDAEKMNVASANALLKTLEEPGPGAVLILLANDPDQVIQTIRSRCQSVFFGTLEPPVISQIVRQQGITENETQIEQAVRRSDGSVENAIRWLQQAEQQNNIDTEELAKILARGSFRAEELAKIGEAILEQSKSDPGSQREAAKSIIENCLNWLHLAITNANGNQIQQDCWADALEQCFEAFEQIDRRASVTTVLDTFYHELEINLRPTWQ